jgi:hypothetical protein
MAEIRQDQHGTTTGYRYGCGCDACRAANRDYRRAWVAENREYVREWGRVQAAKRQAQSLASATRWGRWEPREDALLGRIPSNISAASALKRTVNAVRSRRARLRAKGV